MLEQAFEDALRPSRSWPRSTSPTSKPYTYLALREPDRYAIESGSVVTTSGLAFPVADFPAHITEEHVAHSNALHARLDGEIYAVGSWPATRSTSASCRRPARTPPARAGLGETCRNPFRSIIVRAVELAYACEEALRIIDGWTGGAVPNVAVRARAGEGCGASEAPRGTIFHRYVLDADGVITDAQIVPPTSQNQPSIEADLWSAARAWADLDDHALTHRCEHAIRNYDPCISCATHFLDLRVTRS